jgi:hypothetical protein
MKLLIALITTTILYSNCTPKELRGLSKEDKEKMRIVYRHNKGVKKGEDCYASKDLASQIEAEKQAESSLAKKSRKKASKKK